MLGVVSACSTRLRVSSDASLERRIQLGFRACETAPTGWRRRGTRDRRSGRFLAGGVSVASGLLGEFLGEGPITVARRLYDSGCRSLSEPSS